MPQLWASRVTQGVSMIESLLLTAVLHMPTEKQPHFIGYQISEYQGKWYNKKWESLRKCIMFRESRFNYRAENKTSSAKGVYQFLDSQWRDSLVWMMRKEGGDFHKMESLRDKPISQWSRYYQDRAFFTAWQHGEGASHWDLTRHNC